MNAAQPELSFPSEPITGETRATVALVGNDWRAEDDWERFQYACRVSATREWVNLHTGESAPAYVNPNVVRSVLDGSIEPRRYSAFWHRAARGKDAFLVADGWVINTDAHGRNQGKPLRRYRLREAS